MRRALGLLAAALALACADAAAPRVEAVDCGRLTPARFVWQGDTVQNRFTQPARKVDSVFIGSAVLELWNRDGHCQTLFDSTHHHLATLNNVPEALP